MTNSNTSKNTIIKGLEDEAESLFRQLRKLSSDGIGVTRPSYSPTETKAIEFLEAYARSQGLEVERDAAQNAYFAIPHDIDAKPYILIGSHIDSVPNGGNYDGLAGIIAGILCLIQAKNNGIKFLKPVKVVALRGEESAWFGLCYIGSRSLLGQFKTEELDATHRETGKPLSDYMKEVGVDLTRLRKERPLIDPDGIDTYLELHIEQGPVLVETQKPLAIVSGIRGNIRYQKIHCLGEAGHSGAVPREFRHDTVFAVSSLLMRLDDHWKALLDHGADLVITCGIINTNYKEHAMSRIPGEATFSFEARSEDQDILETVKRLLLIEAKVIEGERKVVFQFDECIYSPPAELDSSIISNLKRSAENLGIEPFVMASGAGHDAAVFANTGISSGMLFVRNQHGSHNPEEAMELDDFIPAVRVLFHYLTEQA